MQNGGVLDNNNVDNKNKGKAIQLGSLSEDDHQLEVSILILSMLFISVVTPLISQLKTILLFLSIGIC